MTRRHFNLTAKLCGLESTMERIITDILTKTPTVIENVGARLPAGFPGYLFDVITTSLQKSAQLLDSMPPQ